MASMEKRRIHSEQTAGESEEWRDAGGPRIRQYRRDISRDNNIVIYSRIPGLSGGHRRTHDSREDFILVRTIPFHSLN